MGAMANDRRVAALQPDVYSSKMENGMTGAEADGSTETSRSNITCLWCRGLHYQEGKAPC